MAKLYYQLGGPGQINVYDDPQVLSQNDLIGQRDALSEILGLSDVFRSALAQSGIPFFGIPGGHNTLADFDDFINEELDRLNDVLDYFSYSSRVEELTVRDNAWFTPEAVVDVSHEEVGNEAVNAIDGDFGTWWQSNEGGTDPRTITFRVRSYSKKIEGIRLRISNPGEDRAELQDVTIRASKALAMIDDPGNVFASGIDFSHDGDAWMEHIFASPAHGKRFIKLDIPSSLHSNPDHVRIREIEVRVGTTAHNK